jgi:hypothetical protein
LLRNVNLSEDLGVDGRIILKYILGKYGGKVWNECDSGSDQWWGLVNTVMNLRAT